MTVKYLQKTVLLLALLMLSMNTFSQTPQQRENLRNLSRELGETYERERQEAVRVADSLGIPVREVIDDVIIIELQRFENGHPVYYTTFNHGEPDGGAQVINTSEVWDGGSAGLSLSGEGFTLGIWDGGRTRLTHQEFENKTVVQVDNYADLSSHATHVAGTMIAEGIVDAAKGMAYKANLDAYHWGSHSSEMADAAADGLKVSNHSYGSFAGWEWRPNSNPQWRWHGNTTISETEDHNFGRYETTSETWDEIANDAPYYLIVKAAGNSRGVGPSGGTQHEVWDGSWVLSTATRDLNGGVDGYNSIPTYGVAKNIMAVGNVNAAGVLRGSSSFGPTDDGRIKPDIVAKGVDVYSTDSDADDDYGIKSGTSMSSPMISGSVGLLLEHQENLHGEQNPMLASTMKALIIHTAQEMGGHPGPDYGHGWGMMDTQRAAELMSEDALAGGDFNIRELSLADGQTKEIEVIADGNGPLKVTIVWNDPAGTPVDPPELNPANLMLVNDLDMRIASNPTVYEPWVLDPDNPSADATTGDNFRDNVEQIFIEETEVNDVYTITIDHKGTLDGGSQDFSLIVTGIREEPLPIPLANWAIYFGIFLMTSFVVIRFRKLV